jgi:uncharacterized protein YdhG (YjbR/CyaY superfamily)
MTATAATRALDPPTARRLRAYFAALPPKARRTLKQMRTAIRATAPGSVEVVSYGIPAFKLEGRMLVWYAAWKEHTSIYPMKGVTGKVPARALKAYAISKGTIRFPLDQPLPMTLIKRVIRARMAAVGR